MLGTLTGRRRREGEGERKGKGKGERERETENVEENDIVIGRSSLRHQQRTAVDMDSP